MNAYEMATPLANSIQDGLTFTFGIDHTKIAKALRAIADNIDIPDQAKVIVLVDAHGLPQITVERISLESVAARDDFTTTKLRIEITVVEKVQVPA
jgi:hypothetical protein